MFGPRCRKGHSIGFRRTDDHDIGSEPGWFTLRCIQCDEQPLVSMRCPHCAQKGVHSWFHKSKKHLMYLRCASCRGWIDNKAMNRRVLRDTLKAMPFLIGCAITWTVVMSLLARSGVSAVTLRVVQVVLVLFMAVPGYRLLRAGR